MPRRLDNPNADRSPRGSVLPSSPSAAGRVRKTGRVVYIDGRGARRAVLMMFGWCPGCDRQARMITPREAAGRCAVSVRTIYRWVAIGAVHHTRTPEGWLLICYVSLFG